MKLNLIVLSLLCYSCTNLVASLTELERLEAYDQRYPRQWPPKDYLPNTEGWRNVYERRFQQLREMDNRDEQYLGWVLNVFPAFLALNYTEYGFGLARAPPDLTQTLQQAIRSGLERGDVPLETEDIGVIEGPRSLFLERPDLTARVLQELHRPMEAWSRVDLIPHEAYGFRIYQNQSLLGMHLDKRETHVVSAIYHIDRSADAQPWPIYIEDFYGRTHEVHLEPGDILFYESSKCLHGRPTTFEGTYFTSVFVHYYPVSWPYRHPQDGSEQMEPHWIVPPGWDQRGNEPNVTPLEMLGTSLKEPSCRDGWCALQDAIPFSGTQDGFWIDPAGKRYELDAKLFGSSREKDEL